MIVETGGSLESVWVLRLSHLQMKQMKMYHLGVSDSICIEVVHPKNLNNEHVYMETSCILEFKVVERDYS